MNRNYQFKVGQKVKMLDESILEEWWMHGEVEGICSDAVFILFEGETESTRVEPANFNLIRFLNCITIGKIGMSTYYQPFGFVASSDVTILKPNFQMSVYTAMFIVSILSMDKYKWSYGRQIRLNDSQKLSVMFPVNSDGEPDWNFMDYYIKSLPYSKNLDSIKHISNAPLSDEQLVSKYESGGIELATAMEPMLQTPSNSSTLKKSKKKT